MCGIAGIIINKKNKINIEESIKKMLALINHRGPDNSSYSLFDHDNFTIALGSTRLAIRDISVSSDMPITKEGSSLVYNGEIYNNHLITDKYKLNDSKSDTLMLFDFLKIIGTDLSKLHDLSGMFSFAFLDGNRLILARDFLGIKPLYFYQGKDIFIFSSELKSIKSLVDNFETSKLDVANAIQYLNFGFVHGEDCLIKSIKSLNGGHALELNLDDFQINEIVFKNRKAPVTIELNGNSKNKIKQELKTDIFDAIKKHCVTDVPMGVIASGGVDSSLIAIGAKRAYGNVPIYHAEMDGYSPEYKYVKQLSVVNDLPLKCVQITRDNYLGNLVDSIYYNDSPHYHPSDIALYLLCKTAREDGLKVLLCGEGADEVFGGYRPYNRLFTDFKLLNSICVNSISSGLGKIIDKIQLFNPVFGNSNSNLLSIARYTETNVLRRVLSNNFYLGTNLDRFNDLNLFFNDEANKLNDFEAISRAFFNDRIEGHLQSLLTRNDRMGMWASIETRVPFLDKELFDKWYWQNRKIKVKNDFSHKGLKYYLKLVLADYMGDDFVFRKKQGFPVPIEKWLKRKTDIFKDGFLINELGIKINDQMVQILDIHTYFYYLNLEIWGSIFLSGKSKEFMQNKLNVSQELIL